MDGSELKPFSPPTLHKMVRYRFGEAMPKSVRLATVKGSSKMMRNQTIFGSRHVREMKKPMAAGSWGRGLGGVYVPGAGRTDSESGGAQVRRICREVAQWRRNRVVGIRDL